MEKRRNRRKIGNKNKDSKRVIKKKVEKTKRQKVKDKGRRARKSKRRANE